MNRYASAFTLIELVLYTGLLSVVFGLIIFFMDITLQSRAQQMSVSEVEYAGVFILSHIRASVQGAQSVESPDVGMPSSVLQLSTGDSHSVSYKLQSGVLLFSDTNNVDIPVHSDKVVVKSIQFSNDDTLFGLTKNTVRIELVVGFNSPNTRKEFQYEQDFTTSVRIGL